MSKKVYKQCVKCKRRFALGWDGIYTITGYKCDSCAGVQRDAEDMVWLPGETEQERVAVGRPLSEAYTVNREEAFK